MGSYNSSSADLLRPTESRRICWVLQGAVLLEAGPSCRATPKRASAYLFHPGHRAAILQYHPDGKAVSVDVKRNIEVAGM